MIPLLGYAMYICIYIHIYICICICVHIQIHIQIDTNIYIYRYIHNVTYMHIHTYINTKKFMYRHISTCLPARDTIHTSHVTRVTRLIHKCDMTHFICVTWLIYLNTDAHRSGVCCMCRFCTAAHLATVVAATRWESVCMWHDSIHVCNTTRFIRGTWLIHDSFAMQRVLQLLLQLQCNCCCSNSLSI